MEIVGIPIIFIILLIVFVIAAFVFFVAIRRNNRDANLYDKRWKVYNPDKPSLGED